MGKNIKIKFLASAAFIVFLFTVVYFNLFGFLQGNLHNSSLVKENENLLPDFIIKDVVLQFYKKPDKNSTFYTYKADIKIKNIGEKAYLGSDLYISAGENHLDKQITNNENGMNFEINMAELVHDYQIFVDKNNEEDLVLNFKIDPDNLIKESNENNNIYSVTLFNKINNFVLSDISSNQNSVTLTWEPPTGKNNLNYHVKYLKEKSEFDLNENSYKVDFGYKNTILNKYKWYASKVSPYLLGAKWSILDINPERIGGKYEATLKIPDKIDEYSYLFIIEDTKYAIASNEAILINQ